MIYKFFLLGDKAGEMEYLAEVSAKNAKHAGEKFGKLFCVAPEFRVEIAYDSKRDTCALSYYDECEKFLQTVLVRNRVPPYAKLISIRIPVHHV